MTALWWVLWGAVAVALVWQVRRVLNEPLERDRIVAEARRRAEELFGTAPEPEPYGGPDSLRLLQDTDDFLNGLVDGAPELAAGFDRLRQAIRDEQKGETS